MKAELLIRATSRAQSLDNLTYTGRKDKKITAQCKETYSQTEKLDISTIQGALGLCRLPPLISNLLYAKYQRQITTELEDQVSQFIARRWRGPPLDVARATNRILWELLYHHVCQPCGGSGKRMVVKSGPETIGKILECGACGGSGTKKPNEKTRARQMNIPYTSWRRKYAVDFSSIQYEVNALINQGEVKYEYKMA